MSPIQVPRDGIRFDQINPWDTPDPSQVPGQVTALEEAISAHFLLLDSVRALFGDAVAESLSRSVAIVEEKATELALGVQVLQSEIVSGTTEIRHLAGEVAKVREALDVATMQEARDRATIIGHPSHDVTLMEAAEFNRDERVRLFNECQARQATIEEMSNEMDRGIMATSMEIDTYRQAFLALVREKVITRKQCNQIQRDAEAAYRDAT